VKRKRPELWRNHNWLLHHENAPTHTSLKTIEFVTNNSMVIVPHPPYSPDLAPCDLALSPKLKMKLKGRRFETVSDIQRESQAVLDSIKEIYFHGTFETWEKKKMGSLYTFPRRLFRKRWQPKFSKLSEHFFFYLFRELSDTPRRLGTFLKIRQQ
jgi:transposase